MSKLILSNIVILIAFDIISLNEETYYASLLVAANMNLDVYVQQLINLLMYKLKMKFIKFLFNNYDKMCYCLQHNVYLNTYWSESSSLESFSNLNSKHPDSYADRICWCTYNYGMWSAKGGAFSS